MPNELADGALTEHVGHAEQQVDHVLRVGPQLVGGRADRERVRAEYYAQSSRTPAETQIGSLAGLYEDPTVDSLIVQVGFCF